MSRRIYKGYTSDVIICGYLQARELQQQPRRVTRRSKQRHTRQLAMRPSKPGLTKRL